MFPQTQPLQGIRKREKLEGLAIKSSRYEKRESVGESGLRACVPKLKKWISGMACIYKKKKKRKKMEKKTLARFK